jgi:hypothetical protein
MKSTCLILTVFTVFFLLNFNAVKAQPFIEQTSISLYGGEMASVDWGDYDNDGDLDILLCGGGQTRVYKNNGNNTFVLQTGIALQGISGVVRWGDYNNDGYLDILLSGWDGQKGVSFIYKNNGNNTFTKQTNIVLQGLSHGDAVWGDYDNDGDLDVLLVGKKDPNIAFAMLYKNNGNNTFSLETDISLTAVTNGSAAFGDFDNDGFLDIFIHGLVNSTSNISKIYKNNGNGNFIELTGTGIGGFSNCSFSWGDYDNDGDLDIAICGGGQTKVYKNDGNNTFIEQTSIVIDGVTSGAIAWGDYDNDGKLDILITGQYSASTNISKLYKNNGNNTFTFQSSVLLDGVKYSSVGWADYDNDGDLDILLSGTKAQNNHISKIYKNNGTLSNYAPVAPNGMMFNTTGNKIQINWNRGNDFTTPSQALTYNIRVGSSPNGFDIKSAQSNSNTGFHLIAQKGVIQDTFSFIKPPIHIMDTSYLFFSVQAIDHGFASSLFSATDSVFNTFTIDAGDPDTILPGDSVSLFAAHNSSSPVTYSWSPAYLFNDPTIQAPKAFIKEATKFFVTVTKGTLVCTDSVIIYANHYTNVSGYSTANLKDNASAWGDYDNDGDLDLFICGGDAWNSGKSKLFKNNGYNSFTEQTSNSFTGVVSGSVAWGDYDNDGDLDLLLAGSAITKIYKNNLPDSTGFSEQTSIQLQGIGNGDVAWGDYDNDGDLDILLAGSLKAKVYRNNGNNTFTELTGNALTGVYDSSVGWCDYDGDGDLDIIIAGRYVISTTSYSITKIYRNMGNDSFVEQTGINICGVLNGDLAWGDYDNDGDLDLVISGFSYTYGNITKIYENTGNNNFAELTGVSLVGTTYSSVSWGDYDNDGDPDILLAGQVSIDKYITKIYSNLGNGNFADQGSLGLSNASNPVALFCDYDNDGDLDLYFAGGSSGSTAINQLYKNNYTVPNSGPDAPNGLQSEMINNEIRLSWNKVQKDSLNEHISYNIRVGTSINVADYYTPHSDLNTGFLRVVEKGIIRDTFCIIDPLLNLTTCSYLYWSVQAIDHGYEASDFAPVDSVLNSIFMIDAGASDTLFPFDTIQLNVSHNSCTPVLYSWTPTACLDNPNIQSPKAFPLETTTYYVTVTKDSVIEIDSVVVYVDKLTYMTGIQLFGVGQSAVDWGDYDNDGDLDILLMGYNSYSSHCKIYKNMGNDVFVNQTSISLTGFSPGTAKWGDYNNDNYLDILISSEVGSYRLYKNNGNNTFSNQTLPSFGTSFSELIWIDYDNDGDLDIFVTGYGCKMLENQGSGTFILNTTFSLGNINAKYCSWGDYNNDGYSDVIVTGHQSGSYFAKLYINNGDKTFMLMPGGALPGLNTRNIASGDYDSDGDLDFIFTGFLNNSSTVVTRLFQNIGNGYFVEKTNIPFIGVTDGTVDWGDLDNDGDLDVLITGIDAWAGRISKIYRNDGDTNFVDQQGVFSIPLAGGAAWGDYDNDGDLDILLTGNNQVNNTFSRVYRNNYQIANSAPTVPVGLNSDVIDGKIVLSWQAATDNSTSHNALSYNLFAGSNTNPISIICPHSNISNGFHKISGMGNSELDTNSFLALNTMYAGDTLFWGVQALDNSFLASAFSAVDSLIMPLIAEIIRVDTFTTITSTCSLDVVTNYNMASAGTLSYSWSPAIGLSNSNIKNPVASYSLNDTTFYSVTVTSSDGLSSTDTFMVVLYPIPTATFNVTEHSFLNTPVEICYTGAASVNANYLWNFDGGNIISGSNQGPYLISWNSQGIKNISLIVNESGYTSSIETKSITIDPSSEICLVTVDSSTQGNIIVWSNNVTFTTDYYKIYKESSIANVFDSIGYQPYLSANAFYDLNTGFSNQAAKYKISEVDIYGNESVLSLPQSVMHLQITQPTQYSTILNWTSYQGFQVVKYRVWKTDSNFDWKLFDSLSSGNIVFIDTTIIDSLAYYRVEAVSPYTCIVNPLQIHFSSSMSNIAEATCISGIDEKNMNSNIIVYPNPAQNMITVKSPENLVLNIKIADLFGRIINDINTNSQTVEIDISNLSVGIYFISIWDSQSKTIKKKIIKI